MVKLRDIPSQAFPSVGFYVVSKQWKIQESFFKTYNVIPDWINCNFTFGTLNLTTGQWSGAVGVIQRNEADYAVFAFASTYERSKVATFSSVTHYYPLHWLTKYPQKLSPTWNLMGLFTKGL